MGANQNSSRNLAYIPESTQIHITQNPAVLKPRLAVEHRSKSDKNQHGIGLKENSGNEIVVRARVLLFGKTEPTTATELRQRRWDKGAKLHVGAHGETREATKRPDVPVTQRRAASEICRAGRQLSRDEEPIG
jgi:hypothetical protein